MGKRNTEAGNKPKKVRKKTEIIFDETKRRDFLTGFRKRKEERRKRAKSEFEKKLKDEIKSAKEKAKKEVSEIDSASHRVVPEIEHLLENAGVSTNIHDLGPHTVSVTHLDLDKKKKQDQSDESEESDAGSEEEKPKSVSTIKTIKPFDKKMLSKTNNKLQAFKKGKGGSKFHRKTMKSKRD